jgi:hypothetical protein
VSSRRGRHEIVATSPAEALWAHRRWHLGVPEALAVLSVLVLVVLLASGLFAPMLPWAGP